MRLTDWWTRLRNLPWRLWLANPPVSSPKAAVVYPHRACPSCGRLVAFTKDGSRAHKRHVCIVTAQANGEQFTTVTMMEPFDPPSAVPTAAVR